MSEDSKMEKKMRKLFIMEKIVMESPWQKVLRWRRPCRRAPRGRTPCRRDGLRDHSREWHDWENMAGEFCDGKNHTGSLHATYDDPGEPHDGASRKIPRLQQTIPQDNHVGEPDEGERYPYRGMPRRTSPEAATLSEDTWWLMDAPMPLDQSRWILLEIPF